MLQINGQALDQLDPRFAMRVNNASTHPSQFSLSMVHDMRIGIDANLSHRPNLKPSYRKRVHTAAGHLDELIDFMDQDEEFGRIKERFRMTILSTLTTTTMILILSGVGFIPIFGRS